MRITEAERLAIQEVVAYGEAHGFGNLISHLQTVWAEKLMGVYGIDEKAARAATVMQGGYPFAMQRDLMLNGQWDETGKRYSRVADAPQEKPYEIEKLRAAAAPADAPQQKPVGYREPITSAPYCLACIKKHQPWKPQAVSLVFDIHETCIQCGASLRVADAPHPEPDTE